ncbi:hypothetical protein BRC89_08990 [Halobacteriales archaeon QS_4_70_19]|nr:MAG: hypothetical protein BRC89_08990 [Halobacteriales archaeon QS_4_70_19]
MPVISSCSSCRTRSASASSSSCSASSFSSSCSASSFSSSSIPGTTSRSCWSLSVMAYPGCRSRGERADPAARKALKRRKSFRPGYRVAGSCPPGHRVSASTTS